MSARALVVDASSVIEVLIDPGDRGDAAAARMATARVLAPKHLPVEVGNVLRRRRNAGLLEPGAAARAWEDFWAMPVQLWPLRATRDRIWQLGRNLSSYDAAYVALAELLDAPLLTADARLARSPGPDCVIELVE